jgi:RNA binding exosome subunit
MEDGHEVRGCGAGAERRLVKKLSCQEVLDQLSDYLEEDAAAELRTQIESHLNGCRHCHLEVDTLRRTIQLFRVDDAVGLPLELSEKLRAALEAAYREKGCGD